MHNQQRDAVLNAECRATFGAKDIVTVPFEVGGALRAERAANKAIKHRQSIRRGAGVLRISLSKGHIRARIRIVFQDQELARRTPCLFDAVFSLYDKDRDSYSQERIAALPPFRCEKGRDFSHVIPKPNLHVE